MSETTEAAETTGADDQSDYYDNLEAAMRRVTREDVIAWIRSPAGRPHFEAVHRIWAVWGLLRTTDMSADDIWDAVTVPEADMEVLLALIDGCERILVEEEGAAVLAVDFRHGTLSDVAPTLTVGGEGVSVNVIPGVLVPRPW